MTRAKTTETVTVNCPCCGELTTRKRCQRCCDIGGGFLPEPPEPCVYAHRSPIGNHLCVDILMCAYRCGNMDCPNWMVYSRMNSNPVMKGKVEMKKKDVQIGETYAVKVSGSLAPVKLISESSYGGWEGRNLRTGRTIRIKTAAKLRFKINHRF